MVNKEIRTAQLIEFVIKRNASKLCKLEPHAHSVSRKLADREHWSHQQNEF